MEEFSSVQNAIKQSQAFQLSVCTNHICIFLSRCNRRHLYAIRHRNLILVLWFINLPINYKVKYATYDVDLMKSSTSASSLMLWCVVTTHIIWSRECDTNILVHIWHISTQSLRCSFPGKWLFWVKTTYGKCACPRPHCQYYAIVRCQTFMRNDKLCGDLQKSTYNRTSCSVFCFKPWLKCIWAEIFAHCEKPIVADQSKQTLLICNGSHSISCHPLRSDWLIYSHRNTYRTSHRFSFVSSPLCSHPPVAHHDGFPTPRNSAGKHLQTLSKPVTRFLEITF